MDPIDDEIRQRLEKLRESRQQVPSTDELRDRLTMLKGTPVARNPAIDNKYILFPKPRSTVDQVNDLMEQMTGEANLRSNYCKSTSVDEIEKRLQKLKADDQLRSQPRSVPETPRESDTKILLKKILAEAELEKQTEQKFPHLAPQFGSSGREDKEEKMDYSEEEFCTICPRAPQQKCLDCDHLFCGRCFLEYHEEIGERHRRVPFESHRRNSLDSDSDSD